MLRQLVGDAPFLFVVGKGGVGKTTTAAALALDLADAGEAVRLISTDPAHSLRDVVGDVACSPDLVLEEFDAAARAAEWRARGTVPLTELIEAGTWLDGEDVAGLTRLALPGVDELMAMLRLVELGGGAGRVVVDTAPTGHTLRLLDAAQTHAALARALRAMAAKAAVVASGMTGTAMRLRSETFIDELDAYVSAFRERVLDRAAFVLVARTGRVVEAETARLAAALDARGLRRAASVWTGEAPTAGIIGAPCLVAPLSTEPPRGCAGMRAWSSALATCDTARGVARPAAAVAAAGGEPALEWLRTRGLELWLVAGKGGVGKSTCAAALAVSLAERGDVLLCGVDPAGSLGDVLGGDAVPRVRVLQVDAAAELERLRALYRDNVMGALERLGLSEAAVLDRRVIEALWELAPPGIDEIAALGTLLDLATTGETVVLDSAPTGHFLRLLEWPDSALDWVHQLMRLIVKYGAAAEGGAAAALLRTARELRALDELLHDARRAGVVVVTLDEPVVHAETDRLVQALDRAGIGIVATVINRSDGVRRTPRGGITIRAPALAEPPVGARALRRFATLWKIVP